ncbi:hypothetical protein [Dyella sp.]|uniref:hypothetical protein n=1 Tax=Dyella sp. TaxID=1869338 RepID=UPI002846266E|nr:hypothetical protein [Dyella sp.]MDR3446679.1 hypothetical protein [Dyella sp.]
MVHAPIGFFPAVNDGDLAIPFCFDFLLFVLAGSITWNFDRLLEKRATKSP